MDLSGFEEDEDVPTPATEINAEIERLLADRTATADVLVNFLLGELPQQDIAAFGGAFSNLRPGQLFTIVANLQLIQAVAESIAKSAQAKAAADMAQRFLPKD